MEFWFSKTDRRVIMLNARDKLANFFLPLLISNTYSLCYSQRAFVLWRDRYFGKVHDLIDESSFSLPIYKSTKTDIRYLVLLECHGRLTYRLVSNESGYKKGLVENLKISARQS